MKFLLLATLLALSATAHSASSWTSAGKITSLEDYGNGIKVYGMDLSGNPASCQEKGFAMPNSGATPEAINRLNSMLLAAYMAKQSVQIKLSGNSCSSNNPFYYAVRVVD